jgi:hypothetical protein
MSEAVVEQCDPREREAEIRALFARNGQAQFDAVFERAYRPRAADGLRSWIGRLGDDAVMHISVTPMRFTGGGRTLMGGVLGDLMADEPYRDFWSPVRLLRAMVADLKRAGEVDFLFTTTVADAEPVFKAGGFKPFGTLRRYVLPLSRTYRAVARLRGRVARHRATPCQAHNVVSGGASPPYGTGHWRPQSDEAYYATRIPRLDFADATWLAIGRDASGCALVCRHQERPELTLADAFWNEDGVGLGEVVHAAGRWGHGQRLSRLSVTTVQETRVARQLERAGFFARDATSKLLMQPLGPNTPPPVDDLFLPSFALTSW